MGISSPKSAVAVILAGGEGRRLGGVTKATVTVDGLTLLERVRAALAPQVGTIILSLGSHQFDTPWADATGLPIVTDPIAGAGPLGGIAGALVWCRAYAPEASALISTPVDVPFLPADLVARLMREDGVAVAESGGQRHYAITAWPLAVADDVLRAVAKGDVRIRDWQDKHPTRVVSWPMAPFDPFLNINTPEDLAAANDLAPRIAAQSPRGFA